MKHLFASDIEYNDYLYGDESVADVEKCCYCGDEKSLISRAHTYNNRVFTECLCVACLKEESKEVEIHPTIINAINNFIPTK